MSAINNNEQAGESQPPIGMAGFACLVCLAVIYMAANPVVSWLEVWWAGVLIYSVIPTLVAFTILYRSSWHQELPRVTRILSMILSSCIIFCVALVVLVLMVVVASMFVGFEAGH
jgi:hypothetical protein